MNDQRRQCTAHSSRTGERCRRAPILGGTVCRHHGGGAPQVQLAAKRQLWALVDVSIRRLRWALESNDAKAIVQACKLIVERAEAPPPPPPPPAAEDWSRLTDGELELLGMLLDRAVGAEAKPLLAELPVLTVQPERWERWGDPSLGHFRRVLEARVVWLPRDEAIALLANAADASDGEQST